MLLAVGVEEGLLLKHHPREYASQAQRAQRAVVLLQVHTGQPAAPGP